MSGLPDFTRLLAIGLLNYCDDDGYFMAAPQSIRGAVFPFMDDSRKITVALRELSNHGYLRLGKLPDGRDVGHVVNFLEHQVINKHKHSKIKELAIFPEQSRIDTVVIPSGMEGNGNKEQGKGKGTVEDLKSFAIEIGLPESDGASMFDHWEANGWRNGSNPVRDWKAGIRKWKSQGWLPSQKRNSTSQPKFSRNTGTTNQGIVGRMPEINRDEDFPTPFDTI